VLAGLSVVFPVRSQLSEEDEPEYIRAQRIKPIERRLYDVSGSERTLTGRLVTRYDRQGNLVESAGYTASGALRSQSRYRYDADNRQVEYITEPAAAGFESYTRSYKLDEKGQAIEERDHHPGGVLRRLRRFTLDAAGRVVEEATHDGAGVLTHIQRTRYDAAGNPVEYWSLEGDGRLVMRVERMFRKKGQELRAQVYGADNRLGSQWESVYSGERLSGVSYFVGGTLQWRYAFERDASGLVASETLFDPDGKVTSVEKRTYELYP
jgi:hypothetical protein